MKNRRKYQKNLVSIVMPVYNAEKYLKEALDSIFSQTYKNFELIVADDRSTDGSLEILLDYSIKDKRIKIFRNKIHSGFGKTLNKAIKEARGEFIARMDGDDVMVTKRLSEQVKFLKKNSNVITVGSWCYEMDSGGRISGRRILPIKHKEIYEMMYYLMGLQHPTVMYNAKLIPSDFSWCSTPGLEIDDDLDVLFRLLPFGKFTNIPEYLMYYRIHDNNLSLKFPKKTFIEASKIRDQAVKLYGYVPTLKAKILRYIISAVVFLIPEKYLLKVYSSFRSIDFYH